jgi:hypothetical protein
MKPFVIATVFALATVLVSACASGPSASGSQGSSSATSASGSSGVTVFGTVDASVSHYKDH